MSLYEMKITTYIRSYKCLFNFSQTKVLVIWFRLFYLKVFCLFPTIDCVYTLRFQDISIVLLKYDQRLLKIKNTFLIFNSELINSKIRNEATKKGNSHA